MINEEQRRELIKTKKSFMSLFDGFLVEISTTSSVDKQNLNKLLEGLKKIIFVQLTNLKNKELQSEKVASWQDYTLKRLGGCYNTLLMEAGIMKCTSSDISARDVSANFSFK